MDNNEDKSGFNFNTHSKSAVALKKYLEYCKNLGDTTKINLDKNIENIRDKFIIEKLFQNEKLVKILLVDQKILYVTENIKDNFGWSSEEVMTINSPIFFDILHPDHLDFPLLAIQMNFKSIEKVNYNTFSETYKVTYFGLNGKKKDNSYRKFLMMFLPLDMNEQGMANACILTMQDITHLIKSELYWGRISYGEDEAYKFHFNSKEQKLLPKDIISDREKDVLKLIAQGLESKEIANQLFISTGTVNLHRKNMIARTGARDTTALVQLCHTCGII